MNNNMSFYNANNGNLRRSQEEFPVSKYMTFIALNFFSLYFGEF